MMKPHLRLIVLVMAGALCGLGAGCGGNAVPPTPPRLTLSPHSAGVAPGGTVQFSAMMGGMPTSDVTWSVNGTAGGSATAGTISAGGLYTAPQVSSATLFSVQATLTSNNSSAAFAPVAVMLPGTVSVTHNPQVALYSFNVPEASTVKVEFGPDTSYGLETWSQPTPSGGGAVNIMVAGMRGFTEYHMRAVVSFADGTEFDDADKVFTTGGLSPDQIPSMAATTTPGMTPNSGVEFLDLLHSGSTGPQVNVVATDLSGNVIWYFDPGNTTALPNPVKLLPDGNVLINYDDAGSDGLNSLLEEVNLAGDVVWQMNAADLNAALAAAGYNMTVTGTHHDVAVLPNGHLIVIASMNKDFTDLTGYPGTTTVTGDVLIDLDQSRKPVWVWSEFDHLDVNRHPMSFPPDWTHTNAILYSSDDGDLIISVRHQFWLIKIDYDNGQGTGDIVWKLGWQGDFTLNGGTDPVDWFYAQHGPSFVSMNTAGVVRLA
ncbi:MAG TPA: aryl-sulfate sulfotransferase, partial [Terriglobia bacterium]|nr:aryl-sulfate sulfotransferase [Terriglobia bacterium]